MTSNNLPGCIKILLHISCSRL